MPEAKSPPIAMDLDINWLVPSPTNPRRRFDEDKLLELARSIETHGILQPLVVRQMEDDQVPANYAAAGFDSYFEIVTGGRRYRAAALARLKEIPCTVHALTNTEVLEIQAIENGQREDVHPLEEAESYRRLLDQPEYQVAGAVEKLGEKLGKTKAYIYAALKLLDLAPEAKTELLNNAITPGHAILMARLPEPVQQEILTRLLYNSEWKASGMVRKTRSSECQLSVRELKERINVSYSGDLSKASWDMDAPDMIADAAPCSKCLKRSDPNGDEFGKNRCLDKACYAAKAAAFELLTQAAIRAQHPGAIPVMRRWGVPPEGGLDRDSFVECAADAPGAVEAVCLDDFAGVSAGSKIFIRVTSDESPEERKKREEAECAQRQARDAKRKADAKFETTYRKELFDRICTDWCSPAGSFAGLCANSLYLARCLVLSEWNQINGTERKKINKAFNPEIAVDSVAIMETLLPRQVERLGAILVCNRELYVSEWEDSRPPATKLITLCTQIGVDINAVRKRLEESLQTPAPSSDVEAA